MFAILDLLNTVVNIYLFVLFASAILSWLVAFGVVNRYDRAVVTIGDVFYRLTNPILAPIRRILPPLGGMDFSPLVAMLLLNFLRNFVLEMFGRLAMHY